MLPSSEISFIFHCLGAVAAIDALFTARTSQGAIAWVLTLVLFPIMTFPTYLVFGRRRFRGYRKVTKKMLAMQRQVFDAHREQFAEFRGGVPAEHENVYRALERVTNTGFLSANSVELLSSGKEFFDSLLRDIREAKKQVCLCYYIVRDDSLGQEFKKELIAANARGVEVLFLYDTIGSLFLSRKYSAELRSAGIKVFDFNTRRGLHNFFQINFRNHRKMAIVDQRIAYVGGANIGDEYRGRNRDVGFWKDVQVRVKGPAVNEIQVVFSSDWAWATQTSPRLEWSAPERAGGTAVLTVATGPIDEREKCLLFFQELIGSAEKRLWIATPYFVPDDGIYQSLKLAAIRGVDVRILTPRKTDNRIAGMAANFYFTGLVQEGVKVFQYRKGFLHEKVVLVDDHLATVGSVNFDNRSMRLSFETTLAIAEPKFAGEVAAMFETNFKDSEAFKHAKFEDLPILTRLFSNIARLFSPVL